MTGLLFAQSESDIAFTTGYNKFDDPNFLRKGRFFFGIRGGIYQDGYGFQLGYERAQGANCQGLNLDRIYTNALAISNQPNGIRPYALLSGGYESSNIHEHKPSQAFIGAGVGIRKSFTPNMNGFLESRVLRKLKSDDTDIITTVGLALALNNSSSYYPQSTTKRAIYPEISPSSITLDSGYSNHQPSQRVEVIETSNEPEIEPYVEPHQMIVSDSSYGIEKEYYVQMMALSKSDPNRYVQKLHRKGIDNVEVKQIRRGNRYFSLIVVGPFYGRSEAKRNLRRLKKISRGAFITKL
jgi:hypothetical protein